MKTTFKFILTLGVGDAFAVFATPNILSIFYLQIIIKYNFHFLNYLSIKFCDENVCHINFPA